MKFAFMLVTRGRPARAAAVLQVAQSLASGQHDIKYIVGCDNDDTATNSYFYKNHPEIEISSENRPTGLGSVWNRLTELVPDADIYCPFPDDCFISLPDWDEYIAQAMQWLECPQLRLLAWNDLANQGQCTLPIVSKEWLGLTGALYDDRFPYWFYDTCVDELYSFVTGCRITIPEPLKLVAKKGLTHNLRELPFWWEFYVATRQERLATAGIIRERLGIELEPLALIRAVQSWERRDKIGRDTAFEVESSLTAERKPPPEQYCKARDMAEAYLNTNKAITQAPHGAFFN